MNSRTNGHLPLGVGYYSRAEAARLLRLTPTRVSRWVRGYTYWLERSHGKQVRRRQDSVIETDLPHVDGAFALSFLELIELRILRVLVEERGIPLQTVRKAAHRAREEFGLRHPFASRKVYTHRREIFAELDVQTGSTILELTGVRGRHLQIQATELLSPYLEEIEFSEGTSLAFRWWPLGRGTAVVLDPSLEFGAPVVYPTRVRTEVVYKLAQVERTEAVMDSFRLERAQVSAAIQWEEILAAAA